MEYIFLRNSEMKVSRICMGCCPMGGYGWGEVSDNDLTDAVLKALDVGVNFFDTADIYGLGKSEEILGKALKGKRSKAIIATKFGVRIENGKTFYDNSIDWITKSLQASLKRLNTDYIDLYQIHYRDYQIRIDEVVDVFERLKKKGYILYYGLSNIHQDDMKDLTDHIGKFVSFQNEYSLANRLNENDMFELSKKLNLTPLTWGSLGQGILTGKYNINTKFETKDRRSKDIYQNFHGEKFKKNLEIVDILHDISKKIGKSISSIAIRFILDYLRDCVVLVGIKNSKQLLSNIDAMGWNLSKRQLDRLLVVSTEKK